MFLSVCVCVCVCKSVCINFSCSENGLQIRVPTITRYKNSYKLTSKRCHILEIAVGVEAFDNLTNTQRTNSRAECPITRVEKKNPMTSKFMAQEFFQCRVKDTRQAGGLLRVFLHKAPTDARARLRCWGPDSLPMVCTGFLVTAGQLNPWTPPLPFQLGQDNSPSLQTEAYVFSGVSQKVQTAASSPACSRLILTAEAYPDRRVARFFSCCFFRVTEISVLIPFIEFVNIFYRLNTLFAVIQSYKIKNISHENITTLCSEVDSQKS